MVRGALASLSVAGFDDVDDTDARISLMSCSLRCQSIPY